MKNIVENIWITGKFNNKEIIGRSYIHNNKKMIAIINEDAIISVVDYNEIENICKINFIDKTKENSQKITDKSNMLINKDIHKNLVIKQLQYIKNFN